MCGIVNFLRLWLQNQPVFSKLKEDKKKQADNEEPKKRDSSTERKKAALEILDEEIQSLNKNQIKKGIEKQKNVGQADKFAELQLKALLGGKIEKKVAAKIFKEDDSMSNDLDFNDIEIQFENKK